MKKIWKNKKNNTLYELIDDFIANCTNGNENQTMMLYRDKHGNRYVRDKKEFLDKFIRIENKICTEKIDGNCPLHNLHCSYPKCEELQFKLI